MIFRALNIARWPLLCLFFISGCAASPDEAPSPQGYPQAYLDRLMPKEAAKTLSPQEAQGKKSFERVFSHLKSQDLGERITQSYAQSIYFNDTFRTVKKRDELITYLQKTADSTPVNSVHVLDVFSNGNDIYIKWKMSFTFHILGDEKRSHSIGISHLKLNSDGQIVLHQDFWDGVEGFYQHLPIIGGWIKNIREDL